VTTPSRPGYPAAGPPIVVAPEVADALADQRAVVALESTLIAHGLPAPDNRAVAARLEAVVRDGGAVPATVAVLDGVARVGLDPDELDRVAAGHGVVKASVRDLPMVLARRGDAATTVSSTMVLAHRAGIAVFATGGLGGVHRGAATSFDESADLVTLSQVPMTVVCAGVKSILDVGATLERLETLGVTVVGYQTDDFPGFYLTGTGHPLTWRAESVAELAAAATARDALALPGALVVAHPLPVEAAMDLATHDALLADGLATARAAGVVGRDVTPFLLAHFHAASAGASLAANVTIVVRNAALAAAIAVAGAGG